MKKTLIPLILLLGLGLAWPAAAQDTPPTLTATVVFGTAIIREGPDLAYPVVAQAAQNETLTAIGRTEIGDWYQVTLADGGSGWLADYLVTLDGSAALLPVIVVEAPWSDTLYLPPGCEYFGIGPFRGRVGQSVVLTQGWEAASPELIEEYLASVIQIVSFDGRLVSTYNAYRGEVFFNEPTGTWRVFWSFDMGPIAAGEHVTELTQMFSRPITDGLDANGDGQPDQYGPDPITSRCAFSIE